MAGRLYDGPVVDAHHHLWDRSLGRHFWLKGASEPPLARDQPPADYRAVASGHNVIASVHVEANWDPADPYGEVEWLDGLDRSGGVAARYVAAGVLADPKIEHLLDRYAAHPRVVGIREILSWHPDPKRRFIEQRDRMDDVLWRRGLGLLARHGLSFDLMITPWQMDGAARLVADFPETFFVLNHCGSPIDRDGEGMDRWRRGLQGLARAPNVAIKISDPVAYDPGWTIESLRPVIRQCIDAFGPARCLFASDYPVVALHASFHAIYDAFKRIVSDLSEDEQLAMFSLNACAIYHIVPDELPMLEPFRSASWWKKNAGL